MQHDVQAGSAWSIRLQMARQGWISETRLKADMPRMGEAPNWHYMCWFSRWDWQGYAVDKITVTQGATVGLADPDAWKVMRQAVLVAARKAVHAWNTYTDQRPFVDGQADYIERSFPLLSMRKCVPTENIPEDILRYADAGLGASDATLSPVLAMAEQNIEYEDDLTHLYRNSSELRNRKWGLDVHLMPRDWHGERLLPSKAGLRFSSNSHLESLQGLTLKAHLDTLQALKAIYGPGQGLPPGFAFLADSIIEEEHKRRLQDVAYMVHDGLPEPDELDAILRSWKQRWSSSQTLRKRLDEPCLADVEAALAPERQNLANRGDRFQP